MSPRKLHTRRFVSSFSLFASLLFAQVAFGQDEAEPIDVDEPEATEPAAEAPAAPEEPAPAVTAETDAEASAEVSLPAAEPTAAPADAAADAEAEAAAEAAAIEAQMLQEAVGEAGEDEYKLDIYGFIDFTYVHAVKEFEFNNPYPSFAVGRFNLYLASDLGDGWKTLAETRFTYLPNGNGTYDATGVYARQNTQVADYVDLNRPIRWGGTVIERAWLEYGAHPLLNIRMGHYLTPYGIWNVDHGSPVIIGVKRPFIVGESLMPASQTGLELHGQHLLGPAQLGYHLTLSNGRGPIDTHVDLNKNKAIGGRLYGRMDSPVGTFGLGVSGYKGRYTDRTEQFVPNPDGTFGTERPRLAEYDETALGADLKWEWSGFLLQSEALLNDVVFDDVRPQVLFAAPGQPPGFLSDYRRIGVYGLTGYRFDFIGMMPFGGLEYYDAGSTSFLRKSAAFWGGLNVRPTPRVVLKAQYTYSWFIGEDLPDDYHFNNIDLQAAWSF